MRTICSKVLSLIYTIYNCAKYDVMQYALRLYSPKMHLCRNLNINFHFFYFGPLNLMPHWTSENKSYLFFRKRLSMWNLEISCLKSVVTWHYDSNCFEFVISSSQINTWKKIIVFSLVCYLKSPDRSFHHISFCQRENSWYCDRRN